MHALGRDLGVVHDHLDREPVDQGREPERELVGLHGGGELPARLSAADDVGELRTPALVEHLSVLGHLGVAERADPDLDPERPLVEASELGQVGRHREVDQPAEPILGRGDPADLARGPQVELIVRERQGFGEQTVLRFEVVQDQAGRHAGLLGDVGDPGLGEPAFGDDARRGVQDLLVTVLPLLHGAGTHEFRSVERWPILAGCTPVFERQFSNSTPLTCGVNRVAGLARLTDHSNAWEDCPSGRHQET